MHRYLRVAKSVESLFFFSFWGIGVVIIQQKGLKAIKKYGFQSTFSVGLIFVNNTSKFFTNLLLPLTLL